MENSLFEDLITDNKELLERGVIDNGEVFSQINQFLLKLVPFGNRVPLFSKNDLLNKDMQALLKSIDLCLDKDLRIFKSDDESNNKEENLGLTVEEWFYKSVFFRTDLDIKPIDSRENTQLLLPQSLREIIQVAEIFSEMNPLKNVEDYTEFFQELIENLSEFKQYIDYKITTQFSDNLSMLNFFREWDSVKSYSKNHLTYSYIYNLSKNSKDINGDANRVAYPFNLWNREEYNLTIGDVLAIIEEHKHLSDITHENIDYYFFYLIKVNYSIYLSLKFYYFCKQYICDNNELSDSISEYFELRMEFFEFLNDNSKNFTKSKEKEARDLEEKCNDILNQILDRMPDITEYLQIINTNFMPQNFNYLSYRKQYDKEDYKLILPSFKDFQDSEDINKEDYFEFLQDFFNSELTVKSDIRSNIEHGKSQFRYRNLYTFLPISSQKGKLEYIFNFFINLTKLEYVLQIAQNYLDKKMNKKYIYKNVFHTDFFIRRNYSSRDTTGDIYLYTLNQINATFKLKNKITNDNEQEVLATILFHDGKDPSYSDLYDSNKSSKIFDILKTITAGELKKKLQKKLPQIDLSDLKATRASYVKIAQRLENYFYDRIRDIIDINSLDMILTKIKNGKVVLEDIEQLEKIYNKYTK